MKNYPLSFKKRKRAKKILRGLWGNAFFAVTLSDFSTFYSQRPQPFLFNYVGKENFIVALWDCFPIWYSLPLNCHNPMPLDSSALFHWNMLVMATHKILFASFFFQPTFFWKRKWAKKTLWGPWSNHSFVGTLSHLPTQCPWTAQLCSTGTCRWWLHLKFFLLPFFPRKRKSFCLLFL